MSAMPHAGRDPVGPNRNPSFEVKYADQPGASPKLRTTLFDYFEVFHFRQRHQARCTTAPLPSTPPSSPLRNDFTQRVSTGQGQPQDHLHRRRPRFRPYLASSARN